MSEHGNLRMTAGSMTRTCGGGSSTPFLGGGAVHGITSTQRVPSAAENSGDANRPRSRSTSSPRYGSGDDGSTSYNDGGSDCNSEGKTTATSMARRRHAAYGDGHGNGDTDIKKDDDDNDDGGGEDGDKTMAAAIATATDILVSATAMAPTPDDG